MSNTKIALSAVTANQLRLALVPAEAAEAIGVSAMTLRNWRAAGEGPPFVRLTPSRKGRVLYRVVDLDNWLAGLVERGGIG